MYIRKKWVQHLSKYFFVVLPFPLVAAFLLEQADPKDLYKPSADFNWLKTYISIYYTFSAEQWENNPDRSFDSAGVHLTKKQYHPVNACHYALYCFDEYKATKNERFKKAFLAQVKYLLDSTKYDRIDGDKIGYPYKFAFHDLKNPWYSALAQSEAISVLIRYYVLTKDAKVIPDIVAIKNFMVNPQSDCGTLSYTPENNVWLEEYPNSKQEKQVLNGFFLAIVALKEFSDLFPEDKGTKELYEKCVISAKESIKFYDTGSWLKYNRGDGHAVANGYMKWQVNEMRHLYEVTNDIFFKKQFMLWATYGYNREFVTPGCKVAYYNWGIPLEKVKDKYQVKSAGADFYPLTLSNIKDQYPPKKPNFSAIFDNNPNTFMTYVKNDSVKTTPFLEINTSGLTESEMIQIRVYNDTITKGKVDFYYRSDTLSKWKEIKIKNISYKNPKTYEFEYEKTSFNYLKLQFNVKDTVRMNIAEVKVNQKKLNVTAPEFYYYHSDTIRFVFSGKPQLNCIFTNADDFIIFYKSAANKDKLKNETWSVNRSTTTLPLTIDDNQSLYQFLIILKRKGDDTGIASITPN